MEIGNPLEIWEYHQSHKIWLVQKYKYGWFRRSNTNDKKYLTMNRKIGTKTYSNHSFLTVLVYVSCIPTLDKEATLRLDRIRILRISPYSVWMRGNAGKTRIRITPNTDTFYTVSICQLAKQIFRLACSGIARKSRSNIWMKWIESS